MHGAAGHLEPTAGMNPSQQRLLFVSGGLSPRGGGIAAAGRLLLGATREWAAERGIEVRILTLGGKEDLPAGVHGEAFDGNRRALAGAVWRSQLLDGFRHHVYDFLGMARIQGVLPRRLQARYLVYLYGIECWRPLRGSRRRALAGAAVRLACSRHTVERLRRHNPGAPAVVPLHLAVAERAEREGGADADLLARAGDGFVLVVGRFVPTERYKGHDELIGAVATLAASRPQLRLVVVGEGEDRSRLEGLARASGIADRVLFTGFVADATLDALYHRCALFAMPSRDEGFGLVYLEAMRAGRPCLALAGSAAAEIVVDGETGRLVSPGAQSIAVALAELLDDPDRAAAMGEAGRSRWQREFRRESFAAGLRPHLDSLLFAGAAKEVDGPALASAELRSES